MLRTPATERIREAAPDLWSIRSLILEFEASSESRSLNILHLSDLHARASPDFRPWIEGEVWERQLETWKQSGVDLVTFAGDVASTGKAEEYEVATLFFKDLLRGLDLGPDRLFVVPGNHARGDTC